MQAQAAARTAVSSGSHCDYTPKNLSSFGINGKVTLDAGDEYTFTLVLDDPEPSREPSSAER